MQYLMIVLLFKKEGLIKKGSLDDRNSDVAAAYSVSYLVARLKHLENVFAEVVVFEAEREN